MHAYAFLLLVKLFFPGPSGDYLCVVHVVSPAYHPLARQARIEGDVRLDVKISREGEVISAKALFGHQILRDDAEKNVREWRFNAAREQTLSITYEYRLEQPEVEHEPPSRVIFDFPARVRVTSNFKPIDHPQE
jgi:TonB family protein